MKILDRLFLVKKIVSREGKVHFRRWRLAQTPLFAFYLHEIARSDEEHDPHDHPWPFVSFILKGGYTEKLWRGVVEDFDGIRHHTISYEEHTHRPGSFLCRDGRDFHKITLLGGAAWTVVLTGPRNHPVWGYKTDRGWVDHLTYRREKRPAEGALKGQ